MYILNPFLRSSLNLFQFSAAYDPLDPTGNITIKWDIMSWTADGYVVSIYIYLYFLPSLLFCCSNTNMGFKKNFFSFLLLD